MNQEDRLFCEIVVAMNFVSKENCHQIVQIQKKWVEKGQYRSVSDWLLYNKIITQEQIDIVLNEIAQKKSLSGEVEKNTNKIGRYSILGELGSGGMGLVYKAYDNQLRRTVALKVLTSSSAQDGKRFMREAAAMAQLEHPNIVKFYEFGIDNGKPFLVMEMIDGLSLKEYASSRHLTNQQIAKIMSKVCSAISYIHQKGFIHRDLKPANIMMNKNDEPRVMDFGLAKATEESQKLSRSGAIIGTLSYMSPEQALGKIREIDGRSDVYSLGAVLYELLTKKTLFTGDSISILYQIAEKNPILPRKIKGTIAKDLENICLKALEKEKSLRYQTSAALEKDLNCFIVGDVVAVSNIKFSEFLWKKTRKHKRAVYLFLTLLTFGFLISCYIWMAKGYLEIKFTLNGVPFAVSPTRLEVNDFLLHMSKAQDVKLNNGKHNISVSFDDFEDIHIPNITIHRFATTSITQELEYKKQEFGIISPFENLTTSFKNSDKKKQQLNIQSKGMLNDDDLYIHKYYLATGEYELTTTKENFFTDKQSLSIDKNQFLLYSIRLKPFKLWKRQITESFSFNSMDLIYNQFGLQFFYSSLQGQLKTFSLESLQAIDKNQVSLADLNYPVHFVDFNGDGYQETILCHKNEFMILDGKTKSTIFEKREFWTDSCIVKDLNDDNYPDIITFSEYNGINSFFWNQNLQGFTFGWNLNAVNGINTKTGIFCHDLVGTSNIIASNKDSILLLHKNGTLKKLRDAIPGTTKLQVLGLQNLVLLYSRQDGLICYEMSNNQVLWSNHNVLDSPVDTFFAVENPHQSGEVLIHLDKLYCINIRTGEVVWFFDSNTSKDPSQLYIADIDKESSGDEVILWNDKGNIYVINPGVKDKKDIVLKSFFSLEKIEDLLLVDTNQDGILEIVYFSEQTLHNIIYKDSPNVRILTQDKRLSSSSLNLPPITHYSNKQEIIVARENGRISCLDPNTLNIQWERVIDKKIKAFAIGNIQGDDKPEVVLHCGDRIYYFEMPQSRYLDIQEKDNFQNKIEATSFESKDHTRGIIFLENINDDAKKEIILFNSTTGSISCFDAGGTILWQNLEKRGFLALPFIGDIDNDNKIDIVVSCRIGSNYFALNGMVYCINAQDGSVKWQTVTPHTSEGGKIVAVDVDNNGEKEIYCGQVRGTASCLNAQGKVLWHKHFKSAEFMMTPLVNVNRQEVVWGATSGDIYCLDALTGEMKWHQRTCLSIERQSKFYFRILDMKIDINGDNINDYIVNSAETSFVILDGSDGHILGKINDFGLVKEDFETVTLDKNEIGLLFFDRNNNLIHISDIGQYCQSFHNVSFPQIKGMSRNQYIAILSNFFYNLVEIKDYNRIHREFQKHQAILSLYPEIQFFEAIYYLQQQNNNKVVTILSNEIRLEQQVLLLLALLNRNDGNKALQIAIKTMEKDIENFDYHWQKYQHLLTSQGKGLWEKNIRSRSITESKCNVYLGKLYEHSIMIKDTKAKERYLKLALHYSIVGTKEYQQLSQIYGKSIENKNKSMESYFYTFYHRLYMYDEAIAIDPFNMEFRKDRGKAYLKANINYSEVIADFSLATPDPELHVYLAFAYTAVKNFEKASEHVALAQKLLDKNSIYFNIAKVIDDLINAYTKKTSRNTKFMLEVINEALAKREGVNLMRAVHRLVYFP